MEEKIIEKTKEQIKQLLDEGINPNNLEHLYQLVDIYKDIKEVECMNYGNYGTYYGNRGYDSYNGMNYSARGRDMRYRGHDHLDRMYDDYGRYMESRSRYGASDETDKSFHYMVKALEDFIVVLHEEAETPQQKQMLNETLQRSMR